MSTEIKHSGAVFEIRAGSYGHNGNRRSDIVSLTDADMENFPNGTRLYTRQGKTNTTETIRQLERQIDALESLLDQQSRARKDAQEIGQDLARQLERYGLMITYALRGKRHPKEPDNDKRLDAVRAMAADSERMKDLYRTEQSLHAQAERHNAKLVAELAEMQRLYRKASIAARDS